MEVFRQRVSEGPDRPAVVCGSKTLTYRELNEQANRLAWTLRELGVSRGDRVAILPKRGIPTIIGLCGILKAGAAYVPMDPGYPEQRLQDMLADAEPKAVLTYGCTVDTDRTVISLDSAENWDPRTEDIPLVNSPGDIANCIYTSGSTGQPKGVMIEHHSLTNLILWHNRYYDGKATERSTKYAGFGFDASVHEMYPPLAAGGTVYIIPEDMRMDLPGMASYVEREGINVGFFPTPVCEQFAKEKVTSITKVITGGDKLKTYTDQYPIYNNYGPTEGTALSTAFKVDRAYDNIPIGKPIDNVRVYVVSKEGQLQPIGLPGELWLGGEGLARGYIHDEERTAERFMTDPFCPGGRIYKTGDLGKWLPDGNLLYLGRNDFQVKIRSSRRSLEIASVSIGG